MTGRWVVELETDVWIAHVRGDPGRTLVLASAKRYDSRSEAEQGLAAAREYRPFEHAKIYQV